MFSMADRSPHSQRHSSVSKSKKVQWTFLNPATGKFHETCHRYFLHFKMECHCHKKTNGRIFVLRPQGLANVNRTIFIDARYGNADGEVDNPGRPFQTLAESPLMSPVVPGGDAISTLARIREGSSSLRMGSSAALISVMTLCSSTR